MKGGAPLQEWRAPETSYRITGSLAALDRPRRDDVAATVVDVAETRRR